mmetsp:Transcript_39737/g.45267  ORF Transcript_39737/g.45267 Transcript_39737/m.45267 type:complete len:153 (-) Transcript_39737:360-818(-)
MANVSTGTEGGEGDVPEAQLLVSEFPPPPFYYKQAASLTPPSPPMDALGKGTNRAAEVAAKAKAESERIRLGVDTPNTDAILGGERKNEEEEDNDVVAVFGEIVEDPYLVKVQDICEDPTKIRDEVHSLNRKVVQMFIGLVRDLVDRPLENK